MEYFPLGPLNVYLQKAKEAGNVIPAVDLVEAATYVASALYHLDNINVIHGNIRCRKLFVTLHQPGENDTIEIQPCVCGKDDFDLKSFW